MFKSNQASEKHEKLRQGKSAHLDMSRNWKRTVKYMPVFDYDRCSRCGFCATVCTWGEIRLVPERIENGKPITIPVTNRSSCGACHYFDNLLFDACQVTNPPIDPLREPIELWTYLGRRDFTGHTTPPLLEVQTPILFQL